MEASLTYSVSPRRESWACGSAAPPVWCAPSSPGHISSAPPHSGKTQTDRGHLEIWTGSLWCIISSWSYFFFYSSTDLLEALQDALHVLVSPEEVGERALHRVEVGQGLVPLHGQLSDVLLTAQALLLLLVLWTPQKGSKRTNLTTKTQLNLTNHS